MHPNHAFARSIDDVDDMGGQCYAFIRLSVHGVHTSSAGDGTSPDSVKSGSVSIGDTFLFNPGSKVTTAAEEDVDVKLAQRAALSDVYSLTGRVPYFRSFVASGSEDVAARRLLSCVSSRHL